MSTYIILWQNERPSLYCSALHKENMWNVINGGWTLLLEGSQGTCIETGKKIPFDNKTVAPDGYDYTEVMNKASLENEHIPFDAPHPEVKPVKFDFEDEIAF